MAGVVQSRPPKLLDLLREAIRVRHYSRRTEKAYAGWVRRFLYFHGKRHPAELGAPEVATFLSHLATAGRVSASTQNQALCALLFLYREVLKQDLPWLDDMVRAKRPGRLPTVLSVGEVKALLSGLRGDPWLVASLLYGSGLRLLEGLTLRVKDIDLSRREITVRDGKGRRDRRTMLPERLVEPLRSHLGRVKRQHLADLESACGSVAMPDALARKYPSACIEWGWQWVFRPRGTTWILTPACCGGTTCTNPSCSKPSGGPGCAPASPSRPAATPFDTVLQHTYWGRATISALFRNY